MNLNTDEKLSPFEFSSEKLLLAFFKHKCKCKLLLAFFKHKILKWFMSPV